MSDQGQDLKLDASLHLDLKLREDAEATQNVCEGPVKATCFPLRIFKTLAAHINDLVSRWLSSYSPECPSWIDISFQGSRNVASRRAAHNIGSPRIANNDSSRRQRAMDEQLESLGVNVSELLFSSHFEGSPARKAYWSFVNPREGVQTHSPLEPFENAVKRYASQILFLDRGHRARLAEYVRTGDEAKAEKTMSCKVIHPIVLVLDNLRSAHNVGSIIRTAETAGVERVIACGVTPHPPNAKVLKTALRSADYVEIEHEDSTLSAVRKLRCQNYSLYALETTSHSQVYTLVNFSKPCALVVGNELLGISPEVLQECHQLIEIPMYGFKNSMNVACACPVVLYEVLRQWNSANLT